MIGVTAGVTKPVMMGSPVEEGESVNLRAAAIAAAVTILVGRRTRSLERPGRRPVPGGAGPSARRDDLPGARTPGEESALDDRWRDRDGGHAVPSLPERQPGWTPGRPHRNAAPHRDPLRRAACRRADMARARMGRGPEARPRRSGAATEHILRQDADE